MDAYFKKEKKKTTNIFSAELIFWSADIVKWGLQSASPDHSPETAG